MLLLRRQLSTSSRRALSTALPGVGHSGHLSQDSSLRNQHDGPANPLQGLNVFAHAQKYLFDLNGYLVLPNVFDDAFVRRANDAVDAHVDRLFERRGKLRTSGLYGRESQQLAGDGTTGRMDLGGMLGWDAPHRDPFRELLCHPMVACALHELVGVGYRLDHSPLMIAQERGSEGHTLHGGAVTESGEPAWPLAYDFKLGQMRNQLLTVCLQLADSKEGDGGFCVVPGSHKANFPVPPALADLADPGLNEFVKQPAIAPGDVLIFTEAVLHGTLPWMADHQRRTVIYRFAPAGSAYGRGYHPTWPAEALEGMSDAQLAVMQPPYHPRMNRTTIGADGEAVLARPREQFKVEFDEQVFGSRYF